MRFEEATNRPINPDEHVRDITMTINGDTKFVADFKTSRRPMNPIALMRYRRRVRRQLDLYNKAHIGLRDAARAAKAAIDVLHAAYLGCDREEWNACIRAEWRWKFMFGNDHTH